MPNAAYEVLFTTNAPQVEREIKRLHRQVGTPIVPTVDLSQLKALNAELDLKQRHLRQTIAYFKQNRISANVELSKQSLSGASLAKGLLPSSDIQKVAQTQVKQLNAALQQEAQKLDVIDVEVRLASPGAADQVRELLAKRVRGLKRAELLDLGGLAQSKGVSGLEGLEKLNVPQIKTALSKGLREAGDQAIAGLVGSLVAGKGKAGAASEALGAEVLKTLRAVLKIQSPSKETDNIAVQMVMGLINGLTREKKKAIATARQFGIDAIFDRVKRGYDRVADSIGGIGQGLSLDSVKSKLETTLKSISGKGFGQSFGKSFADGMADPINEAMRVATGFAKQVAATPIGSNPFKTLAQSELKSLRSEIKPRRIGTTELPELYEGTLSSYTVPGQEEGKVERVIGLYEELAEAREKAGKVDVRSGQFKELQAEVGTLEGMLERVENISQSIRLQFASEEFTGGSLASLSKRLQALQIRASEIDPDTDKWRGFQRQIGGIQAELQQAAKAAESITLERLEKSLQSGSLEQLAIRIQRLSQEAQRLPGGSQEFRNAQRQVGVAMGEQERTQIAAQVQNLRGSAEWFESGSTTRITKVLQALQLEAAQIKPNTIEWTHFQEQIGQLQAGLRKADAIAEQISLDQLQKSLDFRSIAGLETKLQSLNLRIRDMEPKTAPWQELRREIVRTENELEKVTRKAVPLRERFGAAGGSILYGGGLAGSPLSAVAGLAGGLMGGIPGSFTGAAIGQMADQLLAATSATATYAASVSRLEIALRGVSDGMKGYGENLRAVNDISNGLAMRVDKVIVPYTKLQASISAAGYSADTTKKVFEAVAAASIATGGSAEDLEGSMRAVTQIFAKGTVQSEELVGQLAERIPGAFALFAEANNMNTASLKKALELGQVSIKEFLKFADRLGQEYKKSAEIIVKSQEYAGQRLDKSMGDLQVTMGSALMPIGAYFQDMATTAIIALDKLIKKMQQFGLLGSSLSATFVAGQIARGKRTPESVQAEIDSLQKLVKARDEARKSSIFRPLAEKVQTGLNIASLSPAMQPALQGTRSVFGSLLNDPAYDEAKRQITKLQAALEMNRIEEKNKRGQELAAQDDENAKKQKKLAEDYYNLIRKRDEDLAQAREDHEDSLQDLRKSHAKELLDFEERLNDERRKIELENARMSRENNRLRSDFNTNLEIDSRRAAGEDVSAAETVRDIEKQAADRREQALQREENFAENARKRQEEFEKMKRKNAEEINKANETFAKRVGSINKTFAKQAGDMFVKAAVDVGKTVGFLQVVTRKEVEVMSIMLARAKQGVDPRIAPLPDPTDPAKTVMGTLPRIAQLEKEIADLQKMSSRQAPTPPALPAPTGQVLMPPALPAPTPQANVPYSQQVDAPSTVSQVSASEARQQELAAQQARLYTANDLREQYNEQFSVLGAIKRTQKDIEEGDNRRLNAIRNGINPAIVEEVLQRTRALDRAIKIAESIDGQLQKAIDAGTIDKANAESLSKYSRENIADLEKQRDLTNEIVSKNRERAALMDYMANAQSERRALIAAPGMEEKQAELYDRGITDARTNRALAAYALQYESIKRIKDAFTGLGDSIRESLGSALVDIGTDWTNLSSIVKDTAQSMQNAFKQIANSLIQEFTRAYVNKAVAWLMQFAGLTNPPSIPRIVSPFGHTDVGSFNTGGIQSSASLWARGEGAGMGLGDLTVQEMPFGAGQFGLSTLADFASKLGNVTAYANGAIVNRPTLGLVGEGRFNEAIIPMPNNRSVPVDLKGAVGGNYSTSIAVNISNSSDGTTANSQITGDQGNKFAGALDRAVKQAILDEQRPGGSLYRQ